FSPDDPACALKLKYDAGIYGIVYYYANLCQHFDDADNRTKLHLSASLIEEESVSEASDAEILGALIKDTSDFISIHEIEGFRQVYSNKNFFKYLGYQYDDKKSIWYYGNEIIHAGDYENIFSLRNKIKEGSRDNWDVHFRVIHMNGDIKLIHMRIIPYKRNSYNEITHFVCILRDISMHDDVRFEFTEENYAYQSILTYSGAEVIVASANKQIQYTLKAGEREEVKEELSLDDYLIKHKKDQLLKAIILENFDRVLHDENIVEVVNLDFESYVVELIPVKRNEVVDKVVIALITQNDSTKKERIEALIDYKNQLKKDVRQLIKRNTDLQHQEEAVRVLLDFQKNFIIRFNRKAEVNYVNDALSRFLNADPVIVIHSLADVFIHPEDRIVFESAIADITADPNNSVTLEFRFISGDNSYWTRWEISALFDKNGIVKEYIASGMDYTKKKQYEEAILKSQERFNLIARATNDAIWDWNILTNSVWWNPALYEKLGISETTIPNISALLKVIHPDDKEIINEKMRMALSERLSHWDGEFKCWVEEKQEYRHFFNRAYLTFDSDGNPERMLGSIMDITERKNNEIKYRYLNRSYELAVKAGKTGVWEYKIEGDRFEYDNNLAYLYGYSEENLFFEKKEFSKIIGVSQFLNIKNALKAYLEKGEFKEPFEMVQLRSKKDASKCWMITRASVIFDKDQKPEKLIGTDTDITEQKKAEVQVRRAKLKVEEAMRTKENFFSVMSHEIRSPLSGIIGMNELLLQQNSRSDQKRFLSAIKFSANNLMILINDILDFSKIRAGKLEFENNEFDLHMMLQNTFLSYKTQANDRNIAFSLKKTKNLPKYVKGDSTRLSQILNNLLSNAIKFTQMGSVDLEVKVLKDEGKKVKLLFNVRDTGIGIPVKKQKKIFEPFQQASKDTSRKFGGTGLGLSIVKNLIELQGGEILMESKVNKGTTFSVIIEFNKVKQDDAKSRGQNETVHIRDFRGIKILYIEDVDTNQLIMKGFAAGWGIELDTASDGYEGIHKIQNKEYDMVLMDLQMPGIDGFETTRRIRAFSNPFYKKIPIIALTAGLSDQIMKEVRACGMTDFLAKPVNHDKLYEVIKKHKIRPVKKEVEVLQEKEVILKQEEIKVVELIDTPINIDFSEPDRLFSADKDSYTKFLEMSEKEMLNNQRILVDAVLKGNIEAYRQIHHKMSGLLNLLKLYGFLNYLTETKKALVKSNGELDDKEKVAIEIDKYFEKVLLVFKKKLETI
ncbi:MAG: hypothetical protein CMO01_30460, partial [Thalassobius sp.]|nr:hypothetical protein [Thalassovita sp.]